MLDEALPDLLIGRYGMDTFSQEAFNFSTGFFLPKEFGFDHSGIVDEECISWEHFLDDFEKSAVGNPTSPSIQNHEPGMVSFFRRMLCN